MSKPIMLFRKLSPASRLLMGVVMGAALYLAFPVTWPGSMRGAAAWVVAVSCFLALTAFAVGGAAPERLRARARAQDQSRWVILTLIVIAAIVSLLAAAVLLRKQPDETLTQLILRTVLVGGVVISSWSLTHTVFALHYAHVYYGDGPTPGPDDAGGLLFPGGDGFPDFWDFLYFSFIIGMTCQVSDVQITGRPMRRLATMHGILSFFFNTVILAITINLLVGAF